MIDPLALTPEINGKIRQLKRLILSKGDFKHARLVADYILGDKLHDMPESETHVLLPALNCSMVIAYCRPFSGNDGRSPVGVPDLPQRILTALNEQERAIHDVVLYDRHKLLAHSDADGRELDLVVVEMADRPFLVPRTRWGMAPLVREAVEILSSAARKLEAAVVYERQRLEPELLPYFRKVDGMFDD
jgi:hypothetical protein